MHAVRGMAATMAMASLCALAVGVAAQASEGPSAGSIEGEAPTSSSAPTSGDPSGSPSGDPSGSPSGDPSDSPSGSPSTSSSPTATEGHSSVLVCLATGNSEAPYGAALVVASDVINGEGAVKPGGVGDSPVGVFPDEPWGNIVPPLAHPNGRATFDGLNFTDAGQVIWQDGCGDPIDPTPPPDDEHGGVVVCEATGDAAAPYDLTEHPATHIIKGSGQIMTGGPADTELGVYPDEPWGNIVPPFEHPSGKTFAGINWTDAGQGIWEAQCSFTEPEPSPSPPPVTPPASSGASGAISAPTPTPVASQIPVAEPTALVIAVPEPAIVADPPSSMEEAPEVVSVPEKATLPSSIPAGGGAMAGR
jgi:hypothetical protein